MNPSTTAHAAPTSSNGVWYNYRQLPHQLPSGSAVQTQHRGLVGGGGGHMIQPGGYAVPVMPIQVTAYPGGGAPPASWPVLGTARPAQQLQPLPQFQTLSTHVVAARDQTNRLVPPQQHRSNNETNDSSAPQRRNSVSTTTAASPRTAALTTTTTPSSELAPAGSTALDAHFARIHPVLDSAHKQMYTVFREAMSGMHKDLTGQLQAEQKKVAHLSDELRTLTDSHANTTAESDTLKKENKDFKETLAKVQAVFVTFNAQFMALKREKECLSLENEVVRRENERLTRDLAERCEEAVRGVAAQKSNDEALKEKLAKQMEVKLAGVYQQMLEQKNLKVLAEKKLAEAQDQIRKMNEQQDSHDRLSDGGSPLRAIKRELDTAMEISQGLGTSTPHGASPSIPPSAHTPRKHPEDVPAHEVIDLVTPPITNIELPSSPGPDNSADEEMLPVNEECAPPSTPKRGRKRTREEFEDGEYIDDDDKDKESRRVLVRPPNEFEEGEIPIDETLLLGTSNPTIDKPVIVEEEEVAAVEPESMTTAVDPALVQVLQSPDAGGLERMDRASRLVFGNLNYDGPGSGEGGRESPEHVDAEPPLVQSPINEEEKELADDVIPPDPIIPRDKPESEEEGAVDAADPPVVQSPDMVVVKMEDIDDGVVSSSEGGMCQDGDGGIGGDGDDDSSRAKVLASVRSFKMGIHHVELLFLLDDEGWLDCRMCKTRGTGRKFSKEVKWVELVAHCQFDHPKAWEELANLSSLQITQIKQSLRERG